MHKIAMQRHPAAAATLLLLAACASGACTQDPVAGGLDVPRFGRDGGDLANLDARGFDADADDNDDDAADAPPDTEADPATDAIDPPDDADDTGAVCRNGVQEPGEGCDDGNTSNDDFCLNSCQPACGDGVVNSVETCDTALAADQDGACPVACSDGDPCTTDVTVGTACQTECLFSEITAFAAGDACCPDGADATLDSDCEPVCGNGVLEPPDESCDTAVVSGPSTCPTLCVDDIACTDDRLLGAETCEARCSFDPIVDIGPDDGCCPEGAVPGDDPDCGELCGDGAVQAPDETCDTAIEAGHEGACPADCPSDDVCLVRELVGAGTCTAACSDLWITTPGTDDGCCPEEGNANNDPDCDPICGNHVVEPGEQCDEGPDLPADGCDAFCQLEDPPPTAFRVDGLFLRAPHTFADIPFLGCSDVTGIVNGQINAAVNGDADGDGLFDLSLVIIFRPLDQAGSGGDLDVGFGLCEDADPAPICTLDPSVAPSRAAYSNRSTGACLTPDPDTYNDTYLPPVTPVTTDAGPCFVTEATSISVVIAGVEIPLESAVLAANYAGNPASTLENGLLKGFLSEASAAGIILPADLPLVGGLSLAELLPGELDCAPSLDDRVFDGPPDGSTSGWWFYLNFSAGWAELIE